ncbi:DegT/DnrJ/EryC1/StrS family aminotransferase [Streptomyces sp. FH025]|nr:DegT/DnrJ/EryC1/StrS family aminotransferase [Streptomyces sp. FH025]
MASETRLSPLARLPLSTDFYNRYFLGEDGGFRGGLRVRHIETELATDSLRRLTGARHVNTRPISGMSAMTLVIAALGGAPGDTVISIGAESGGHYATREIVQRLGYRPVTVGFRAGRVDQEGLDHALGHGGVGLVYLDLQHSLDLLDVAAVVEVVRRHGPGIRVHVDCSHTLGLVLGGAVPHPLVAGADSMGGSTHKTFPGPHKGVVFTDDDEIDARLRDAQWRLISSHHYAETLALGLAAAEFEVFGAAYASAVLDNARLLAEALDRRGFEVVRSDGTATRTHQVWLRAGDADRTGRLAARLDARGIRVQDLRRLPGVPGPVIRLGTNEVTFEGAGAQSMELLAEAFTYALRTGAGSGPTAADVRRSFGRPYFHPEFEAAPHEAVDRLRAPALPTS